MSRILDKMDTNFCLKRKAYYSHHPNLTQYFIPVTDAEFRERLERHRGEIAIMLRSSEFNQDKTTLIVTNNPLPLLISGRQLATPFQFFPKDFLRKLHSFHSVDSPFQPCILLQMAITTFRLSFQPAQLHILSFDLFLLLSLIFFINIQELHSLPPVKVPQQQLVGPVVKQLHKSPKVRFATRNDFKTEAHFSKNYDEKHLQKLYPNLRTHMRPDLQPKEPLPCIQGFAVPLVPLTMSCLIETKPTVTVPGEDGFRYGKAPLWIVNSSAVPRNGH
nr:PREDICTED: testis-specific gene 13 protein [Anolis carolinensis]|eukprot:XP_016849642.1 PREDICTED: testis-specific gene 13 protein [Anolis carolinensis]